MTSTAPSALLPSGSGAEGLHYTARLQLADGTSTKIGTLVNNKLATTALGYDPRTDSFHPAAILGHSRSSTPTTFLQVSSAKPSGNGRGTFGCTASVLLRSARGWVPASLANPGLPILTATVEHLSGQQWQVVRGTLMGDGALSPTPSGLGARLRLAHAQGQAPYADWKASLLGNLGAGRTVRARDGAVFWDFSALPELAPLRHEMYQFNGKHLSDAFLHSLSPLALALWYLDDGHFDYRTTGKQKRTEGGSGRARWCVQAMTPDSRGRVRQWLEDTLHARCSEQPSGGKANLALGVEGTRALHDLIAAFVPPCMEYKLLPTRRGQFSVTEQFDAPRVEGWLYPLRSVSPKPETASTLAFAVRLDGGLCPVVDGMPVAVPGLQVL